jgi:hypothetical protein
MRALLPALILFAAGAQAAPEASASSPDAARAQALAAECAKVPCRKSATSFELRTKDGVFQGQTQPVPWLDDQGTVILFPGESVTIGYPTDDSALARPELYAHAGPDEVMVGPAARLGPILTFDLKQMDGKPDMMMTGTNRVKATIKFDIVMYVPTPAGVRAMRTSACPLMPPQGSRDSFSGFEHWPHPIAMMVITHIRAMPAGAAMTCD